MSRVNYEPFHVAHTPFGWRLGYARWLHYLKTVDALSHAAIGEAIGRRGQTVSAWMGLEKTPKDWEVLELLAETLSIDQRWLIRGEGEAPQPTLWAEWIKARQRPVQRPRSIPGTPARRGDEQRKPKEG